MNRQNARSAQYFEISKKLSKRVAHVGVLYLYICKIVEKICHLSEIFYLLSFVIIPFLLLFLWHYNRGSVLTECNFCSSRRVSASQLSTVSKVTLVGKSFSARILQAQIVGGIYAGSETCKASHFFKVLQVPSAMQYPTREKSLCVDFRFVQHKINLFRFFF